MARSIYPQNMDFNIASYMLGQRGGNIDTRKGENI